MEYCRVGAHCNYSDGYHSNGYIHCQKENSQERVARHKSWTKMDFLIEVMNRSICLFVCRSTIGRTELCNNTQQRFGSEFDISFNTIRSQGQHRNA